MRPLRLPTRHGHAPHRGLGGEPQAGGADLEAGGGWRALKLLTVLDEHTRECLAIVLACKIRAHDVLEVLADLFNGKLRDELLNGEIFYSLAEAAVLVEQWRREYNTVRPHSACGGSPPAPEAIKPSPWFLRMPVLHGPPQVLGLT